MDGPNGLEVVEGPERVASWREVDGGQGGAVALPWGPFTRARMPEAGVFLDALADGLTATAAAVRARLARSEAFRWRRDDPAFAEAWEVAYSAGTELFEDETRRRALLGVLEPIVFKGEITGYVRKPSDRLMEMVLKARAPEKYRERVDVQHTAVPLSAEEIRAAREAGMRPEVEAAARTIASLPVVEGTARGA